MSYRVYILDALGRRVKTKSPDSFLGNPTIRPYPSVLWVVCLVLRLLYRVGPACSEFPVQRALCARNRQHPQPQLTYNRHTIIPQQAANPLTTYRIEQPANINNQNRPQLSPVNPPIHDFIAVSAYLFFFSPAGEPQLPNFIPSFSPQYATLLNLPTFLPPLLDPQLLTIHDSHYARLFCSPASY